MDKITKEIINVVKGNRLRTDGNGVIEMTFYKYLEDNPSIYYEVDKSYTISKIIEKIETDKTSVCIKDAFELLEISTLSKKFENSFNKLFEFGDIYADTKHFIIFLKELEKVKITKEVMDDLIEYTLNENYSYSLNVPSIDKLVGKILNSNKVKNTVSNNFADATFFEIIKNGKYDKLYLQSFNYLTCKILKIKSIIENLDINEINIVCNNAIYNNIFVNEKFDIQYITPPFANNIGDEKYGEFLFLKDALNHMSDKGMIIFMCIDSALRTPVKWQKEFIESLIKDNLLEAIIKIPEGTSRMTRVGYNLVILNKNKKGNDVLLFDAGPFFEKNFRNGLNELSDENIKKVFKIYKEKNQKKDSAILVSNKELLEKEHFLIPDKFFLNKKVEKAFKKHETIKLTDVANIIIPKKLKDKGVVFSFKCGYPFDKNFLKEDYLTDTELQKGDIIFTNNTLNSIYLFDTSQTEVYAGPRNIIIRPKSIQPEYLFLLFNSELIENFFSLSSVYSIMKRVSRSSLEKLLILKPNKSENEYRTIFELKYYHNISEDSYDFLLKNRNKYVDNVEDILCVTTLSNVQSTLIQDLVGKDIEELNKCYAIGAYKAAIILAGSILEAVLIDWLSEIDGKDYFTTKYKVPKDGKMQEAVLEDYIDAIKEIKRPAWMDPANKAHTIRNKRNCVHAKIMIKNGEVNEGTCKMVINYLKEVLQTRGLNFK